MNRAPPIDPPIATPSLRGTILDCAVSMGRELGAVDAIHMRSLAQRVGVSATTLYREFEGRAALLAAARYQALAALREHLRLTLVLADPARALCSWIELYATVGRGDPWLLSVLGVFETGDSRRSAPTLGKLGAAVGIAAVEHKLDAAGVRTRLERGIDSTRGSWLLWAGAHGLLRLDAFSDGESLDGDATVLRNLAGVLVGGVISSDRSNVRATEGASRRRADIS